MKPLVVALAAFTLCLPAMANDTDAQACRSVAERVIAIAEQMSGETAFADAEREAGLDSMARDLETFDIMSCSDMAQLTDNKLAIMLLGATPG